MGTKSENDTDEIEEPIIVESALRHGVAEADILHALRFAIAHVRQSDDMVMFIGPDWTGTLIEGGSSRERWQGHRSRDEPRPRQVSDEVNRT